MKAAAQRTGGYFTQINPDEKVGWRAFELLSTLNAPRLLAVKVLDQQDKHEFLTYANSLSQGEQLCAMTRMKAGEPLPKSLTVTGMLNGKRYTRDIPVGKLTKIFDHLPRSWARLEIDRLIAADAEEQKQAIITLSKKIYVMSPFTSLLVLENEAMYKQFNIDRGRKDHWALYPCPQKIKVVYEPSPKPWKPKDITAENAGETQEEKTRKLLKTIVWRTQPRLFHQTHTNWIPNYGDSVVRRFDAGVINWNMMSNPALFFELEEDIGGRSMDFTSTFRPMANGRWNWGEFSAREQGFRMLSDLLQPDDVRLLINDELRTRLVIPMWEQFRILDFDRTRFRRSQLWGLETANETRFDNFWFDESSSSQLLGLGMERNGRNIIIPSYHRGIILFSDGVVNNSQLLTDWNRLNGLPAGIDLALSHRIASYEFAFRMQGRGNQISNSVLGISPDGWSVPFGDDDKIQFWNPDGYGYLGRQHSMLSDLHGRLPGNTLHTFRLVSPEMLFGNGRLSPITLPLPPAYQRPTFSSDRGVFGDLVAHAPGMNTSTADALTVLDAQVPRDKRPQAGTNRSRRPQVDRESPPPWLGVGQHRRS
jgi:hypothetical protein